MGFLFISRDVITHRCAEIRSESLNRNRQTADGYSRIISLVDQGHLVLRHDDERGRLPKTRLERQISFVLALSLVYDPTSVLRNVK